MTVFLWDKTSQAANATADPTVNWPEGQAPSTVNDSARAMMVAIAKWRDDIAGSLTTAGTSTAYTLASNQLFTSLALMNGRKVAFLVHVTNGPSATLNVDGLGAKPLVSVSGTAVTPGSLIANTVHTAVYNNTSNEWRLHGNQDQLMAASGTAMIFQQPTAPTGWTKGATHNDKSLRVVSGTPSTGGTVAFSALFGRTATDPVTLAIVHLPAHTHSGTTDGENAAHAHGALINGGIGGTAGPTGLLGADGTTTTENAAHAHTFTTQPTGSGTAFTVPIDTRVQYVDVILATKD